MCALIAAILQIINIFIKFIEIKCTVFFVKLDYFIFDFRIFFIIGNH